MQPDIFAREAYLNTSSYMNLWICRNLFGSFRIFVCIYRGINPAVLTLRLLVHNFAVNSKIAFVAAVNFYHCILRFQHQLMLQNLSFCTNLSKVVREVNILV